MDLTARDLELAKLCRLDYRPVGDRPIQPLRSLDLEGMHAALYHASHLPMPNETSGSSLVLVCRGSDDPRDWARNIRFWPVPGIGATRFWHRGFLREARVVHGFVRGLPVLPDWVTGHSRGSAIAQIVGPSLGVFTVTFAPPRPLFLGPQPKNANRVVNYALRGDPVPYLGRLVGFRHVGHTVVLDGVGHAISAYIEAIENKN